MSACEIPGSGMPASWLDEPVAIFHNHRGHDDCGNPDPPYLLRSDYKHVSCPHELADEMSACKKRLRKAVSCGRQRTGVFSRGNGADDESTGSNSEGSGREAEVVGSSRDHGGDGPHDAALAGTAEGTRLQRVVGLPEAPSQSQASADEDGGGGVAALPGEVLRLQRAALHEKLRELHGIELSYS